MRTFPLLLILLAGLGLGCSEESKAPPLFPDFDTDVAPLLNARCVRCHGAGGTLNGDLDVTDKLIMGMGGKPAQGYFDCATDRGDCATAGSTTCKRGFAYYAANGGGATAASAWLKLMPPAPAPPLTERESDIIHTWLAHPTTAIKTANCP